MDAMRSCYDTTMRFPGVGLVRVRWFWTDLPPLDETHVYGSHNHSREEGWEDWDTGEPGEVWGAVRNYHKGFAPPTGCDGEPQGDSAAWVGESDESSPLFPCGGFGAEFSDEFTEAFYSGTWADGSTGGWEP